MKHVIIGKPQAQERPRFAYVQGKARVYDPQKSRDAKQKIRDHFAGKGIIPSEKPLRVIIDIYVPIPKSYTKKQREAIASGILKPTKKPDVSNYVKLIEDGCNGILYRDDAQIIDLRAKKHYSDTPRIEIEIAEL